MLVLTCIDHESEYRRLFTSLLHIPSKHRLQSQTSQAYDLVLLYMLLVPKKCHTLPSLCQFSSKSSPSAPLLNTPPVKKNDCPVL